MNAAAHTALTAALATIAADGSLNSKERFAAEQTAHMDAQQQHQVLEVKAGRCPFCAKRLDSWKEESRGLSGRLTGIVHTWVQCVNPKCGQWKSLAA